MRLVSRASVLKHFIILKCHIENQIQKDDTEMYFSFECPLAQQEA